MITQQHLASINRADRDLYAREKVLNSAISRRRHQQRLGSIS